MTLGGHCSLEDLVVGAWAAQERLDCLVDGADQPKGLQRGLATMSAVAQQRDKLQVHIHNLIRLLLLGTKALVIMFDGADSSACCLFVNFCCFLSLHMTSRLLSMALLLYSLLLSAICCCAERQHAVAQDRVVCQSHTSLVQSHSSAQFCLVVCYPLLHPYRLL